MLSRIHLRLLSYSVTLGIHIFTFYDVVARLAVTTKDPVVADFATLQDKFITIWTFLLQIFYVTIGLSCDLLILRVGDEKVVSKTMNWFRETLFSALVWPTSLLIPAAFWPLYLYDNLLVFPPFSDQILSSFNNHVMHSYVAVVVYIELMLLERHRRNHKLNLALLVGYMVLYLITLFSSFSARGSFIYPVLNKIYGTAYFPIFFILVAVLLIFFYCIQWPLTSAIWGNWTEKRSGKKIR